MLYRKIFFIKINGLKFYRSIFYSVLVFFLLITCNLLHADNLKGTIKIGGTGNALGSFRELSETFRKLHPEVKFVILPSLGSGGGIKAVNEGALDLGLSSRPLKDNELQQRSTFVEYARTPFVFVTARRGDGIAFTLQDIAKIYSGEIKDWPDGTPIRLVLRPKSDSDTVLLKNMSPEMDKAIEKALSQEGMLTAVTDQESADAIEKIRGAFGTSTLAQIISEKRSLFPLALNGVMPNMKTLAAGAYPYYKTLYIVTGPKSSPVTKQFVEFITSETGKEVLARTGHLPLKGKQ